MITKKQSQRKQVSLRKDEYKSQISLSIRVSAESYTMTTASSHSLLNIAFNKLFHLKQFLLMQYIQQVKETCEIGTTLNVNWDVWDKISFFSCWIQPEK